MSTDATLSVSERLLPFTTGDSKRFVDLNDATRRFIDYLKARLGCDIHGEYRQHYSKVANRMFTLRESGQEISPEDMDEAWFAGFERDPDVLLALSNFLNYEGLPA